MASAHHVQDPLVGRVIDDRFEMLERVGEGGMGVVYKARQTPINRIVAIKMLNQQMAQDQNWVKRFENEAKACSQLQHPNTIRMFDFGTTRDGRLFMAMEFLDGKSLREAIGEGPMHPARVIKILIQCCASLAEAHSLGIIHRDIKPDNVFLQSMPGSPDFVKLLDFSVAKLLQEGDRMRTQAGVVFGTPQYMSPEQGRGLPLDARSDLYALGILAYEMLTSQVPFNHDNPMMVLQMHLRQPVPALPAQIPPPVQAIVMRALEKDPNTRFQSAGDMMQQCQQVFTQMGAMGFGSGAMPQQQQGPQMGGAVQQMGGAPQQMGAPPQQMGAPPQQMGAPAATPPARRGFAPTSDAAAKTIIAGAPADLPAMLAQARAAGASEQKTMIASGPGVPGMGASPQGMGGPAPMGQGGFPPGMGGPAPMGQGGLPQGTGAGGDDSGPPKTIMLQNTEGIVSLSQQQPGSGAMPAAPQSGAMMRAPVTGALDAGDDDEGASALYWVVCLSGGLVAGVLAYVVIRLMS